MLLLMGVLFQISIADCYLTQIQINNSMFDLKTAVRSR